MFVYASLSYHDSGSRHSSRLRAFALPKRDSTTFQEKGKKMSKLGDKKPKTLVETLQGILTLQNWQTQLLELAILQAKHTDQASHTAKPSPTGPAKRQSKTKHPPTQETTPE